MLEGAVETDHLACLPPSLAAAVSNACAGISHNLNGQRLGRKGRVTRERILAAAMDLIEADEQPVTLARVARHAALGMTSVYNYFPGMTELLLAVLEPVMATAEDDYLCVLRQPWPDDELFEWCQKFVVAYHGFWLRHSRLLHLRNALADQHDVQMVAHRIRSSRPVVALLVRQMSEEPIGLGPHTSMATILMIAIERSVTIVTNPELRRLVGIEPELSEDRYLVPGARLVQMAISDARSESRSDLEGNA